MMPVLDARQMRAADAAAIRAGTPALDLMENAAFALSTEINARFPLNQAGAWHPGAPAPNQKNASNTRAEPPPNRAAPGARSTSC